MSCPPHHPHPHFAYLREIIRQMCPDNHQSKIELLEQQLRLQQEMIEKLLQQNSATQNG